MWEVFNVFAWRELVIFQFVVAAEWCALSWEWGILTQGAVAINPQLNNSPIRKNTYLFLAYKA